ncbi:hypothetical protein HON49_08095 [archaeon]|nr:hypothetical protein [archaeon]
MKKVITYSLIVFFVILLLFSLGSYYTIKKISLDNVEVNNIEFEDDGFTLNVDFLIANNGIFPVKFDQIVYIVHIKSSSTMLGKGKMQGEWLKPGSTTMLNLQQKIFWTPTLELALEMLKKGDTKAQIVGDLVILDLGNSDFTVPFDEEFEIEEHIRQYIIQQTGEFVENPEELWNSIEEVGSK